MKKTITVAFLVVTFCFCSAFAAGGNFGLGIIIGEPTGLSCKYWMGSDKAIDGAAAWHLGDNGYLNIHADYLLHNRSLIQSNVPLYFGLGVGIGFHEEDARIGIRIPLGISYEFPNSPLDAFLEIAPALRILPNTGFGIGAGLGLRFYF